MGIQLQAARQVTRRGKLFLSGSSNQGASFVVGVAEYKVSSSTKLQFSKPLISLTRHGIGSGPPDMSVVYKRATRPNQILPSETYVFRTNLAALGFTASYHYRFSPRLRCEVDVPITTRNGPHVAVQFGFSHQLTSLIHVGMKTSNGSKGSVLSFTLNRGAMGVSIPVSICTLVCFCVYLSVYLSYIHTHTHTHTHTNPKHQPGTKPTYWSCLFGFATVATTTAILYIRDRGSSVVLGDQNIITKNTVHIQKHSRKTIKLYTHTYTKKHNTRYDKNLNHGRNRKQDVRRSWRNNENVI